MKKTICLILVFSSWMAIGQGVSLKSEFKSISLERLKDKIAGGWAGKMLGVTYGAPTEFRAQRKTYDEPINWKAEDVIGSMWQDDLYVQLTFLMTMDRYGMDAPAKKFQELFAKSGYQLWHANVQARKNYFDSIFPPQSGAPKYNLHADDIDFQIEADYIGFMCPGMPNSSNKLASKIGHIMNYGDGVYGGAFLAALYSEAFFESDLEKLVELALRSIPGASEYAGMIRDVVLLHRHYPNDWKAAWNELENKWGSTHICAAGSPFNIDAKFNGAYVVMGLLYGAGDPAKTLEIATRCGQDSDCNPSNALAVLGVIQGLSGMPTNYQQAVKAAGDSIFIHTDYSFNKAVDKTMEYATKIAVSNGGKLTEKDLQIKIQLHKALPLEVSFPKLVFDHQEDVFSGKGWTFNGTWDSRILPGNNPAKSRKQALFAARKGTEAFFTFEGTGVSLEGNWFRDGGKASIYIDNRFERTIDTYFDYAGQQHESMNLYHITGLKPGKHVLKILVLGEKRSESKGSNIYLTKAVVFKTGNKANEVTKFSFQ